MDDRQDSLAGSSVARKRQGGGGIVPAPPQVVCEARIQRRASRRVYGEPRGRKGYRQTMLLLLVETEEEEEDEENEEDANGESSRRGGKNNKEEERGETFTSPCSNLPRR